LEIRTTEPAAFTARRFWCVVLLACVVAVASSTAWFEAAAGETHESTPATELRYPNRYDFIWRPPPLPHYIVAMSQDDALCDSIAKAFNNASTPEGAPPGSLYKAPMFIKWQRNPRKLSGKGPFADVDVTMADPFTEGRKRPVARFTFAGSHAGFGFYQYTICEFPDAADLSAPGWKTVEDMLRDPKCKKVWPSELYDIKTKDSGYGYELIVPTFSPEGLNRIPRSEAGRHDLRVPSLLSPGPEINLIASGPDRPELIVLRNPVTEVTLVTRFEGRGNPPKNICLIGPEVPIDLHLQDRQRARKKAPQ
jgi:hypothetical protein